MLRALTTRPEDETEAILAVIARADADILVLGDVDWDHTHTGLTALQAKLAGLGRSYPHMWFPKPVSGQPSGFDLDGDGRLGEREDNLGYGRFTGDNGVALLSRLPLRNGRTHHDILWASRGDLTGLVPDGAAAILPLTSAAMWEVEVAGLTLIGFANTAPTFDGPEDRNGVRNKDQLAFLAERAQKVHLPVLLGRTNLDPFDGDGARGAIQALLNHPTLQDPRPASAGGRMASNPANHQGDPSLDTADWQDGPGPLRVDVVLPSVDLTVTEAGVLWPAPDDPFAAVVAQSGANRLVWVDVTLPPPDDR